MVCLCDSYSLVSDFQQEETIHQTIECGAEFLMSTLKKGSRTTLVVTRDETLKDYDGVCGEK